LGHARQVDDARRDGRRSPRHDRHPRPSRQPGLPDLLARARLRAVRRQPARPGGVQRRQGEAALPPEGGREPVVPLPRADRGPRVEPGRDGKAVPGLDRRSRTMTMDEPRMTTHISTTTRRSGALALFGGAMLAMALSVTATPAAQAPDAAAKPGATKVDPLELYQTKAHSCPMAEGNSQ